MNKSDDEKNFVKMTPKEMAVVMDAALQHVKNPTDRPITYQIGIGKELMARLWECCGRRKADLFVNTIFDIGLISWHEQMIKQVFNGDEQWLKDLLLEASNEIRKGADVH